MSNHNQREDVMSESIESHENPFDPPAGGTRLLCVDGWRGQRPDAEIGCDTEGDQVLFGLTRECMISSSDVSTPSPDMPVRVLIHPGADAKDVRRLLLKALGSLDNAYTFLHDPDWHWADVD
jgi:hypothetical protein